MCMVSASVFAQASQSPYTFYGIGDIREGSFANQFAMGELGIGTPSVFHINSLNPALLVKTSLSAFQMGVVADIRNLSTATLSETNGSANLNYIAYAFPIIPNRWSSSFGLVPVSRMNYSILNRTTTNNSDTPVLYNYKGEGGLSKAYFSNGVKLVGGLSVGVRGSFVFGNFEKSTETFLPDFTDGNPYTTAYYEKSQYGDFEFGGGLHYQQKLGDKKFLHFGSTYDLPSSISGDRFARLERRGTTGEPIPGDTLISNQAISFTLPKKLGFGISFENVNKLTVGIDARITEWSNNPSSESLSTIYQKGLKLVLGGEITPDISSVDSYLLRTTYRLGASWEKLPYVVNGNDVTDFGINFGTSLPVGAVSSLDLAMKVGKRGNLTDNLIEDNYVQIYIGATINDRWFIRRKYD